MSSPTAPSIVSEDSPHVALGVTNARRWTIVGLLFTASLINYFDRATISFALPLISKELQLGPMEKGKLLSAFFFSYALMQIPVGWCADRLNLRWLYAGAFALWTIAQGLMGLAGGLTALMAFRVLLGIGESIYLPGGSKLVSLLFSRAERGLPAGLFDFGTRTGLVIEGILVPWMLTRYGWRRTFIVVGFSALLWLVPWLLVLPARLSQDARRNQNSAMGGRPFSQFAVVFGVSEPIGGWIADRLVRIGWNETRVRKSVVTVAFLTGLCLIPAARVNHPGAAVALIVGGCFVGLACGNLLVILQSCSPETEVGLWTGVYNFVGNVAGIVSPLITGFLIAQTGSYTPPFVLAAALIAVGPLAFWLIVGELKAPDHGPET